MAVPGTVFSGSYEESQALLKPEMLRMLRWREAAGARQFAQAANNASEKLLAAQKAYAELAGLPGVAASIDQLAKRLEAARGRGDTCLLCLGWGAGFLAKTASADVNADPFRQILKALPIYAQPLRTGLPFPKTRRIVFLNDQPATLPGWVELRFDPGQDE
jgi:CRISPR-associated protein Csm5